MDDDSHVTHPTDPTCFDVYHHVATWIIAAAQGACLRQRNTDAGGLVLYASELEAVRLPIREVMDLLSGVHDPADGPPCDLEYWRSAIHWFSVCDGQGAIQYCRPGQPMPNGMKIHLVEFTDDIKSTPFEYIISTIEQTARSHGIQPDEVLFSYRGVVFRDAGALFCLTRLHPGEAKRASNSLDRWREYANRRVSTAASAGEPTADDDDPPGGPIPMPDYMRGRRLSSKEITVLLRKTRKTLRLWERKGQCPLGIPWPPGKRGYGNAVIYEVQKNWEAISTYLDITFHHDRRWMHALSQATLRFADKHYSVLDDIIAKEESESDKTADGHS